MLFLQGLTLGLATVTTILAQENSSLSSPASSCVNGPQSRHCWGSFDISTDYYQVIPDTGNTVEVHKGFNLGSEPSIF